MPIAANSAREHRDLVHVDVVLAPGHVVQPVAFTGTFILSFIFLVHLFYAFTSIIIDFIDYSAQIVRSV